MPENLPGKIDRAALERIIQRAAELQTGEREIGDNLSTDEVLALGKEVGIPQRYLQQAMLEEQTRLPAAQVHGLLDRLIGPGECAAQRVVRGEVEDVEQRLTEWMDDHELLAIQRQQPGRLSWEPLAGFQAAIRRSTAALGGGRKPFMLQRASLVTATITPLEPGYCHVALGASARPLRASLIGGGAVLAGIGVAGSAILTVMSPFVWVAAAPLPFFLALGYVATRQYRPVVERLQLGLERVLDQLERGDVKPGHALPARGTGLMGLIAEEVKKALRP